MSAEHKLAELRHVLVEQQLPSGGWPALASSSQTVLEPTVYSILALGPGFQNEYQRARQFLLHSQNPNGSWPAFADDDNKGSWATALALVALRDNFEDLPVRLKGWFACAWLAASRFGSGNIAENGILMLQSSIDAGRGSGLGASDRMRANSLALLVPLKSSSCMIT